jgi:hypothetical protein
VAGCAWSSAASAKRIALSGQFVEEFSGVLTRVTPDPGDPTQATYSFMDGAASVTGTWTGQNLTRGTGRINLLTAETSGTYDETSTGSSSQGGFGRVLIHGTYTFGPADPKTGAQPFRADGRFVGGTGDFVGSRGHITDIGNLTGGLGSGTYSGTWILPGGEGCDHARHSKRHSANHRRCGRRHVER